MQLLPAAGKWLLHHNKEIHTLLGKGREQIMKLLIMQFAVASA
jgi:hypothetical protein